MLFRSKIKIKNLDKKEKYNVDKLFYNYSKSTFENTEEKQQELALTQINDLKWYNKIWKLIKKFFRK